MIHSLDLFTFFLVKFILLFTIYNQIVSLDKVFPGYTVYSVNFVHYW